MCILCLCLCDCVSGCGKFCFVVLENLKFLVFGEVHLGVVFEKDDCVVCVGGGAVSISVTSCVL